MNSNSIAQQWERSDSRRFVPDARRRFEVLRSRPFFDFLLLADSEFGGLLVEALQALREEMGLQAILALRKAEVLYDAIDWPQPMPLD
ncbi:hypothetical protein [uncultured Meiothermus sp.]|jgi:hypothetical protein|uniref:hypothetical protein n=1 Tax=uncultured Meiothermus sp. TaxID=157471 RepID=UPI0026069516|nr:hypothetical protein [uncultured Meiothermus sp.]